MKRTNRFNIYRLYGLTMIHFLNSVTNENTKIFSLRNYAQGFYELFGSVHERRPILGMEPLSIKV